MKRTGDLPAMRAREKSVVLICFCQIGISGRSAARYNEITVRKEGIAIIHLEALQSALDYIDEHIVQEISASELAERAGYSARHFSRIFKDYAGISAMSYVTWRKLQFALYDLSHGKKVVDTAMEYGFDTHAGFTKAFWRWFGFPPSLCRSHIDARPPVKMTADMLTNKFYGGDAMNPHIYEFSPFYVIGYPARHTMAHIKNTSDAPTYWNTLQLDYGTLLTKLYDIFPNSKHCEISMCYDVDPRTGDFTYILGRGIDNPDDLAKIQPDMTRVDIAGGLYAVFPTPPVADSYIQAAKDTWHDIFMKWLPQSEFEFDETRHDFEYHDHRDHGWYFDGKLQIDICIPIRQKEEETRKAWLRGDR